MATVPRSAFLSRRISRGSKPGVQGPPNPSVWTPFYDHTIEVFTNNQLGESLTVLPNRSSRVMFSASFSGSGGRIFPVATTDLSHPGLPMERGTNDQSGVYLFDEWGPFIFGEFFALEDPDWQQLMVVDVWIRS